MLYNIKIKTTNPEGIKELLNDPRPIYDGSSCGNWTDFRHACADALLYNEAVETEDDVVVEVLDRRKMILLDAIHPVKSVFVNRINQLKHPNARQRFINKMIPDIVKQQLAYLRKELNKITGKAEIVAFQIEDEM